MKGVTEEEIEKKNPKNQIENVASKQSSEASQVALDSKIPPKGVSVAPGPSKGKDAKQRTNNASSG